MAYGMRTFVDGVACDYLDTPYNLYKVVFVKWFKVGINTIVLPAIPSTGSYYIMSEIWGLGLDENDVSSDIKLVISAGGTPSYYTGWWLKDIKITNNILTFTAEEAGQLQGRPGLLSFDLYVSR